MLRPVIAVVGPTAAGKSELSLALRCTLDGEVVNADSMQLYQGMDIGTAKLTMPERAGVPHHLLDIWPVTQAASVSEYQALARHAIDDIRHRGRTPILVGGSGLYVRAAIDKLRVPRYRPRPAVPAWRRNSATWARPCCMPGWPSWTRPRRPRSCRATAAESCGRSRSSSCPAGRSARRLPDYESVYPAIQLGVELPRPELDQRIADRVQPDAGSCGLVDEVRQLELAGLRDGRTASRALGYAQVLRFLAGEWTGGRGGGTHDPGDAPIRPTAGVAGSGAIRVLPGWRRGQFVGSGA